MLTPSLCPPRPSTECSTPVVERLCGPDPNRGISMVFNDVGGIHNEVRALIYQQICHGQNLCCKSVFIT